MFRAGEEIVCIDDSVGRTSGLPFPCVKGRKYTVSGVWRKGDTNPINGYMGTDGIQLIEIGDWIVGRTVWGLNPSRFRPLAKRSDTLSVESFLTIKPGFEEPKRRVVEPVKEGAA